MTYKQEDREVHIKIIIFFSLRSILYDIETIEMFQCNFKLISSL